jgi:hypothetical protein
MNPGCALVNCPLPYFPKPSDRPSCGGQDTRISGLVGYMEELQGAREMKGPCGKGGTMAGYGVIEVKRGSVGAQAPAYDISLVGPPLCYFRGLQRAPPLFIHRA